MAYITAQQQDLHRVGLNKLVNEGIKDAESTWKRITSNVVTSKQAFEIFATHGGLGLFGTRREGQAAAYDTPAGGTRMKLYPVERAMAIKWTKKSKQKDLYGFVSSMAPLVADSAVMTMNLIVANVFNMGFPNGGQLAPDGVSLFNTAHKLKTGGTQSNLGTMLMSSDALQYEIAELNAQVGPRGIPLQGKGGVNVWCGRRLAPTVHRAARSLQVSGSNDNDTNSWVNGLVKDIVEEDFIGFGQQGLDDAYGIVRADKNKNPVFYMQVQGVETDTEKSALRGETIYVSDFEGAAGVFSYLGIRGTNP